MFFYIILLGRIQHCANTIAPSVQAFLLVGQNDRPTLPSRTVLRCSPNLPDLGKEMGEGAGKEGRRNPVLLAENLALDTASTPAELPPPEGGMCGLALVCPLRVFCTRKVEIPLLWKYHKKPPPESPAFQGAAKQYGAEPQRNWWTI